MHFFQNSSTELAKIKNLHSTICLKVFPSSGRVALPPAFAQIEGRGVRELVKVEVSSDIGLLVETLLISPIAICLFIYLVNHNTNIFSVNEPVLSFYLFWAGLMTLIPLFWYTKGFSLIGIGPASMIFFLTPTAQFFLGFYYFNEPLILDKLIAFIFIWIAVIIYLNELRNE